MIAQALTGLLLHLVAFSAAAPLAGPTVTLDSATVSGTSWGKTSKFLGIPFAQPPVGDLRFRLPQSLPSYQSNFNATNYGLSCMQQALTLPIVKGAAAEFSNQLLNSVFNKIVPNSEDCLTLNVVKPASATPSSKLPVVVWIYGGGFQIGSTSLNDGAIIVSRSIAMGSPVVYVSMNYRLSGFGFLPGKEVGEAGVANLGLHDQREALRWVQKYISQFGGDPAKVTIWGESAGAISISLHMLANGGDTQGLFRGAFMQSGAPIPIGDITHGQKYYDSLVTDTGCSGAADTLQCLRSVPYASLKAAINKSPGLFSYQSLNLAWLPRTDGVLLAEDPQKLVRQGKIANIPYVIGNCDDEGTLFSLSTLNVTSEDQVKTYLKDIFFVGTPDEQLDQLLNAYPRDITQGSPFDSGILNAISPQFKRISAIIGDGVFQAPRRWLLQHTVGKQNIWGFVHKRLKVVPILGSFHTSDLLDVYGGGEMADYLIRFVNTLDPNGSGALQWPQYTSQDRNLMTFRDGLIPLAITQDNFRKEGMDILTTITLARPI